MIRASAPYTALWGSFVLLKMDCIRVARGGSLSMLHQFMICVIPSIRSAGVASEVPLCGVCIRVLVLGWLLSSKLNNGLLCVSVGCVAAVVSINGGGVAVGW